MDRDERIYHHSGRVSPLGFVLTVPICVAVVSVLAVIYGHLMALIPLVVITALLPFLFGIAIGALVGILGHLGKNRSPLIAMLVALALALWGEYLSWGVWVYDIFEESHGAAAHTYSVAKLWGFLKEFAANGSYTLITGTEIRGWMLWVSWFLELLTVVGMALLLAAMISSRGYFCEKCGRWTDQSYAAERLENTAISEISPKAVREGDLSGLLRLSWARAGEKTTLKITVDHCSTCNDFHVFNLLRVGKRKNEEGKTEATEKTLIPDLLITPQEFKQIQAMRSGRPKEIRRAEVREA
ncbi:hypothetical protein JXA47_09275 [Candidatus Sumerlaeota bacterium]|nr:hypothetical protein [Candidatus Sumerlaeota bacterium]